MIHTTYIEIDSRNLTSGTLSNAIYSLPNYQRINNVKSWGISEVSFWNSFYNISSGLGNQVLSTSKGNITIPEGYYTTDTLCAKVVILLNLLGASVFSCSLDQLTKKIIIGCDSNFTISYTNSTCNKILGLPGSGTSSSSMSYTGTYMVNLQPVDFVNIRSALLVPSTHSIGINNSTSNVIEVIPITALFGSLINVKNVDKHHYVTYHHPQSFSNIDLQFTLHNGTFVDFGNTSYRITLEVNYL